MARRRRNRGLDIALGIAQLIALLVLAGLFLPQVRQMLLSVGVVLIGAVVLVGVVAFGVFLIRRTERRSPFTGSVSPDLNVKVAPAPVIRISATTTNPEQAQPTTTADLIERLRAIDWFQFEKVVALAYGKLGYAVTRRGGANPDGGIDIVIEKDGQRSAVQCKQWKT